MSTIPHKIQVFGASALAQFCLPVSTEALWQPRLLDHRISALSLLARPAPALVTSRFSKHGLPPRRNNASGQKRSSRLREMLLLRKSSRSRPRQRAARRRLGGRPSKKNALSPTRNAYFFLKPLPAQGTRTGKAGTWNQTFSTKCALV